MASFDQENQRVNNQYNAHQIHINGERSGTPNWEPGWEYCTMTKEKKGGGKPVDFMSGGPIVLKWAQYYYKAQAQGPRGMYVAGEADELDRLFNQLISDGWEYIGTEEKTNPNGFMDQRWRFRRKVK